MSKILTPVIVREELEKDGIIFGLEGDNAKDVLLEEWGSNLDFNSSWAKGNESLLVYTQSTADGYDLYVCTETHGNDVYWDQDVYYYEDHPGWMERVIDTLRNHGDVWVDPCIWDDLEYEADSAWAYAYEDWYSDLFDEKKDELLDSGDYDDYKD